MFNADELEFARALDTQSDTWWARNFTTPAQNGYALELPIKLGTSNAFYPDFLWWADGVAWAIDTTGIHLLGDKVAGKLLTLDDPKLALVTRGRVAPDFLRPVDKTGWTLVRAPPAASAPSLSTTPPSRNYSPLCDRGNPSARDGQSPSPIA